MIKVLIVGGVAFVVLFVVALVVNRSHYDRRCAAMEGRVISIKGGHGYICTSFDGRILDTR